MASCRLAIRSRSQALLGPANPRSSRFAARSRASRECVPKQSFGTREGLGLGGARASTPLIGGGGQVPHWGAEGVFWGGPKKSRRLLPVARLPLARGSYGRVSSAERKPVARQGFGNLRSPGQRSQL